MTHRLTTIYAEHYCNRTLIVNVIVENVVTCFLGHSVVVVSPSPSLRRAIRLRHLALLFQDDDFRPLLFKSKTRVLKQNHKIRIKDHVRDSQRSRATLSPNFVANQSCLSNIASCPTFVDSTNQIARSNHCLYSSAILALSPSCDWSICLFKCQLLIFVTV